jgi:hypothetical protein
MKKLAAAVSLAIVAGVASASTIQVTTGSYAGGASTSTFTDGLDYQTAVENAFATNGFTTTSVSSYADLALNLSNSAFESTIDFGVRTGGAWEIRAGVDFGKGGAVFLDGQQVAFNNTDMWWSGSYGTNGSFDFSKYLSAGNHVLTIYGVEDCCSGNVQTQFSVNGGGFTSFGNNDLLTAVPESQNFAMLLAGLALLGTLARRRSNKQA